MREILFRGKRTDNGEWVEGCYSKGFRNPNTAQLEDLIYMFSGKPGEWEFDYAVVIPETVGQYTGLTDKNGKKIFEGDICSSKGMVYQVIWLDDKYGWFCKVLKSNSCLIDMTMAFPLYQYDNRPENGYRQLEVIGNIHDNPELMEE